MEFKLSINMDNAAFETHPEQEIGVILFDVALMVRKGLTDSPLRDSNGNTVGKFEITED